MIVATLEIFHSRPIAPTRRIALGDRDLPVEPAPGAGGVLLAGIVAQNAPQVTGEYRQSVMGIFETLAARGRVPQPAARHRFQTDTVGLTSSRQQLIAAESPLSASSASQGSLSFSFDSENARPVQLVMGALYAAATLPVSVQPTIFEALRLGFVWDKPVDSSYIAAVMDQRGADMTDLYSWKDPISWALEMLEIDRDSSASETSNEWVPNKRIVQRKFRLLLRQAHPDQGGSSSAAANRIADLSEARRILLAG